MNIQTILDSLTGDSAAVEHLEEILYHFVQEAGGDSVGYFTDAAVEWAKQMLTRKPL